VEERSLLSMEKKNFAEKIGERDTKGKCIKMVMILFSYSWKFVNICRKIVENCDENIDPHLKKICFLEINRKWVLAP
jgi:hypothetical protein